MGRDQRPLHAHTDGDPFSTRCLNQPASATTCDASGANPTFIDGGYVYAVTVAPSQVGFPVTIEIYDPGLVSNSTASDVVGPFGGFNTWYQLFNTTGSSQTISLDASNSLATLGRCSGGTGSAVFATGGSGWANAWYPLCTFTPTQPGVYPLQVRTSGVLDLPDSGGGWNDFAVRATTSGPTRPTVAAYDKESVTMVSGSNGTTSRAYLANVDKSHAGQNLVLQVFDPGDATSGSAQLQVLAPPSGPLGDTPTTGTALPCSFGGPFTTPGTATPNTSATCAITTRINGGGSPYNNGWLRIEVPIPANYSCTTDCWWSVATTFTASPVADRLTYMVGFRTP